MKGKDIVTSLSTGHYDKEKAAIETQHDRHESAQRKGAFPPAYRHDRMSWKPILLTLFLCLLWGGLTPALKLALQGMPPLAIAAWRFLLGWICIWSWSRIRKISLSPSPRQYFSLFILGILFVVQISALNVGTRFTTSGYAIVLLNTSPLFVAILAHCFIPGDRLTRGKALGLFLAFAGVSSIFLESAAVHNVMLGNLLTLLSGFLLALIYVYMKHLLRTLGAIQVVFWEMAYGVPGFFVLSLWLEADAIYLLSPDVIVSVLYQGLVIAGFCFLVWTLLLERYSASRLTSFQFSIPVFGVLLSSIVLGEELSLRFLLGVSAVATGIFIVSRAGGERVTEPGVVSSKVRSVDH